MGILENIIVFFIIFTFAIPVIPVITLIIAFIWYITRNTVPETETFPFVSDTKQLQDNIEAYIKTHENKQYLENAFCTIKINTYGSYEQNLYIRVINKQNNTFLDITGDSTILSNMFVIFQMYFNEKITYKGVRCWIKIHYPNGLKIKIKEHNKNSK